MNWLKENWFKIGILIVLVLAVWLFLFIKIREHNLDVVNSMRLCANLAPKELTALEELAGDADAVKDCASEVEWNRIKLFSPEHIDNPFRKSLFSI